LVNKNQIALIAEILVSRETLKIGYATLHENKKAEYKMRMTQITETKGKKQGRTVQLRAINFRKIVCV